MVVRRIPVFPYQPAEAVVLVFALFCLVSLVVGIERVPDGASWLFGVSGFVLAVWMLRFVPPGGPLLLRFLRDSYPLWALIPSYSAAGVINRAWFQQYFDALVIRWDRFVFGGHPQTELAALLPWAPLSEVLHFCYYFYLWLLPVLGFSLYLSGKVREFRITATTVATVFYLCFAFFIVFPVLGPYYTFPRVEAPGSLFVGLVHRTLENGAALGTAFPSSHCAAATAMAVCAFRYAWRPLAWVIGAVALGILVGTVYGGFHYAIDSVVGVAIGLLLAPWGPQWHRWLARRLGTDEPSGGAESAVEDAGGASPEAGDGGEPEATVSSQGGPARR